MLDHRVAIETGADDPRRGAGAAGATSTPSTSSSSGWPKPADFEDYRRADIRFHIGVAEAAGSPRLVTAMTEVQGQMSELIALIAHPEQVLTNSNEQHAHILKLLRPATRPGGRALMREHIEGTEHILAGLLPRGRRRG